MSAESTLLFLQQPQIAVPICAVTVMAVAAVLKKWRTIAALCVALVLFFAAGLAPDSAHLVIYVAALAVFFGGAIYDRAWTPIYVALMPIINWSFAAVPTAPIPDTLGGGQLQPLAIVTGLVLVVRDLAQRQIKHWIFGAMILGLLLSTLTSWITIVVASGLAFLISETVDWAVYTFSKKPLSQRIMISSLFSAPLDQVVFIGLASLVVPGIFAWGTVLTGIASKLLGAWIVSRIVAAQERKSGQTEMNPA